MNTDPNVLFNRAFALQEAGNIREALDLYQQLIIHFPSEPQLLMFLGTACLQLENFDEGVRFLEKSLQIWPNQELALSNLGFGLQKMNRLEDAVASCDRAIALNPNFPDAHNNRSDALIVLKRFDEALLSCDRTIALKPDYAEAYNNRSIVFKNTKQIEKALIDCERAIELKPGFAAAHSNRGVILNELKRFDEALISCQHAIALKPNFIEAYNNMGNALKEFKQFEQALANFDYAISLNPDFSDAYWDKALTLLMLGDFEEGWQLYEWRWKSVQKDYVRALSQPLWLGDTSIAGKTILIYPEQGLGDIIQMCRYVHQIKALGANVILEVTASLMAIMSTLREDIEIVEMNTPLPYFDVQFPIMSLPLAFKTTVENVPADVPYLFSDPAKQKVWKERLGAKTKPRIGFVCSGSTTHNDDSKRSIPLDLFKPLFELPFEFHMLQKEIRSNDQEALEAFPHIRIHQENLNDFSDTAALIDEMDLVISVDTSVIHLAGALGKPVWVLISWVPDFRWLLDRTGSPWYPTATLFRQPERENWAAVIEDVCQRLKEDAF